MSREHFISATVLRRHIASRNRFGDKSDKLRFVGDGIKNIFGGKEMWEFNIDDFAAKILCKNHNSLLSPIDTAAGHVFDSIETFMDGSHATMKGERQTDTFNICSGRDLERWLIKVFRGLVAARKVRSHSGRVVAADAIPVQLDDCLMTGAELQPPLGLHMHTFSDQMRRRGLSFGTIKPVDAPDEIGGLLFSLGIMNFALITHPGFGSLFRDANFYRHQEVAYDVLHRSNRIGFLFTY